MIGCPACGYLITGTHAPGCPRVVQEGFLMELNLPPLVFLFGSVSPDCASAIGLASEHFVCSIVEPLVDAAMNLGLDQGQMEDILRCGIPDLLGHAICSFCVEDGGGQSSLLFTDCKYTEDLKPIIKHFGPESVLAINFGPIWTIPPPCRVITVPVAGDTERLAFIAHEIATQQREPAHVQVPQ